MDTFEPGTEGVPEGFVEFSAIGANKLSWDLVFFQVLRDEFNYPVYVEEGSAEEQGRILPESKDFTFKKAYVSPESASKVGQLMENFRHTDECHLFVLVGLKRPDKIMTDFDPFWVRENRDLREAARRTAYLFRGQEREQRGDIVNARLDKKLAQGEILSPEKIREVISEKIREVLEEYPDLR